MEQARPGLQLRSYMESLPLQTLILIQFSDQHRRVFDTRRSKKTENKMERTENPSGYKLKESMGKQRHSNVLTIQKKDLDRMAKDDGPEKASFKIIVHVPTTSTGPLAAAPREDITELKPLTIDSEASKDTTKNTATKPLPSSSKVLLELNGLGPEYEPLDFPLLFSRKNESEKVLAPPVVSENPDTQPRPSSKS